MGSRLRHVTDDDIEGVQHDLAILREHWAEQGNDLDDGDDDNMRERLDLIEKHLGLKRT